MTRGELTDGDWLVIGKFLNGISFVLRAGCPRRDMHERYGKWNSVYVRFRRWVEQGVMRLATPAISPFLD